MNLVKTTVLLTTMTLLFMLVGYLLAGETGMIFAFIAAAAMNLFSWWNSGNMVLKMHNAIEVDEQSAPALVSMVRDLAENADLPMPRVFVLETDQPNAFATGRSPNHAAVAASTGLLDRLNDEEVAAVMAHELAHIKNRDTLTMTITATLAGAIGMLANYAMFFRGGRNNAFGFIGVLATMFLAPMAAGIVQMAVSRTREYEADRDGAEICGNPLWLASALKKIEAYARGTMNESAEHAKATAHMFIINPLNGQSMDNLFSTHPNTENRIAALEQLDRDWSNETIINQREDQAHQQIEPERKKIVFGRDAGQWHETISQENQDHGPWANSNNTARSNPKTKGPWS